MKRKELIISGIIIVIIIVNIITCIYGKNPIYNYVKNRYFPDILNLDEQFGEKEYKTGNQKIEINGYTMVMDQYYLKEDKTTGCARIKITNPDYDMRKIEITDEEDWYTFGFGEEYIRYYFSGDREGESVKEGITACTTFEHFKTIRTKETMYVYFHFGSDNGGLFTGKIYLHDKTALKRGAQYGDYEGKKKYSIGTFDTSK